MRKGHFAGLFMLACAPLWAQVGSTDVNPVVNQIQFPMHAEQWLTTKTALVNVVVNAAVNNQVIEKIQAKVMDKLNQLSNKSEWHIISYDRQQDKTGLENVQITAQARLPQDALSALRDKAKAISVPGESYSVDSIQFTPSEDEMRQVNNALRADIYQQAKSEIDVINKMYPDQKYFLNSIIFSVNQPPAPMPMVRNMAYMAKAASGVAEASAPLSIGNKAELFATVTIASVYGNA